MQDLPLNILRRERGKGGVILLKGGKRKEDGEKNLKKV